MDGIADLIAGAKRWRSWTTLAYYDFIASFRRTYVGAFWQPVHILAWVLGLWVIFGGSRGGNSLEYIAIGVVLWSLLQSYVTNGTTIFEQSRTLILSIPNPISFHLYRRLALQTVRWLTNLPVLLGLLIFLETPLGMASLLFIPALLVILFNGIWVALLLAIIGSRYRDFQFAVDAIMRLLFFLTPVFWATGSDPMRSMIAAYNPFTYFLEIAREPLLGNIPSAFAWQIVAVFSVVGPLMTVALYARVRRHLIFWV